VINPAYPQPAPLVLAQRLEQAGWQLQPRLCVHAAWILRLPSPLRRRVEALAPAPAGGC
jgi:FO synthase subunit 1